MLAISSRKSSACRGHEKFSGQYYSSRGMMVSGASRCSSDCGHFCKECMFACE